MAGIPGNNKININLKLKIMKTAKTNFQTLKIRLLYTFIASGLYWILILAFCK